MKYGTIYAAAGRTGPIHTPGRRKTIALSFRIFAATAALLVSAPAVAQDVKVAIGISGWTGFAPLTLANEAGIFKKNGLDVTIKKIPQKDRHLAIASGDIQCAATTVETWIVLERQWRRHHADVPARQDLRRRRHGGAQRYRLDQGLKGKTVAASAPGTAPYFTLAWILKKNGLSVKDVTVVNLEPAAAAQAFIAGQNDAAMTYEPYPLDGARSAGQGQDHRHHARLSDDHGHVRLHAEIHRPRTRSRGRRWPKSYFEAVDMIEKEQPRPTRSWAPT